MSDDISFFHTDDATYAYQVTGKGEPVVLLHGFTGTKSTWSAVVEKLKFNYQLVAVDLPGHGETNVHSLHNMRAYCRELKKLFNHLNLSQIHLIGYSLGGRTALSFAMLYPEYVSSLILESASPGLKTKEERYQRIKSDEKLAQMIKAKGVASFVDYWENIPLFASQKTLPLQTQQMIRNERLAQSKSGLILSLQTMGTGSQLSWWHKLSQLTRPVLLIVGEKDAKFIDINQAMKDRLSHATLKIINEAGHTVHIEQFESFVSEVSDFLVDV